MKIIFMKGFIQQMEVVYGASTDSNTIGTRKFKIKDIKSIEEVMKRVRNEVNESEIKEVVLVGKAGILRDIEKYYKNIEGVTIKWQ